MIYKKMTARIYSCSASTFITWKTTSFPSARWYDYICRIAAHCTLIGQHKMERGACAYTQYTSLHRIQEDQNVVWLRVYIVSKMIHHRCNKIKRMVFQASILHTKAILGRGQPGLMRIIIVLGYTTQYFLEFKHICITCIYTRYQRSTHIYMD